MDNIEKIRKLLKAIGMPGKQQADICCYVILSMAGIKMNDKLSSATNEWIRIHDIIHFTAKEYNREYAENSRETFRKQAIHHFRTAAIVEDNGQATNSPNYRYRITDEFLQVLKQNGSVKALKQFISRHERLIDIYASKRSIIKIPITINGEKFSFSLGKHNKLQKAIIEDFGARFAKGAECLYVGDTVEKDMVKDEVKLSDLGFEITLHDKMPDVVLYSKEKDWLYFIESVTSVGPMDAKRVGELKQMTQNVKSGKIFVTAFPNFSTYKKFADSLAWETEVWIAEMPDHLIHLNGDKFIGPR